MLSDSNFLKGIFKEFPFADHSVSYYHSVLVKFTDFINFGLRYFLSAKCLASLMALFCSLLHWLLFFFQTVRVRIFSWYPFNLGQILRLQSKNGKQRIFISKIFDTPLHKPKNVTQMHKNVGILQTVYKVPKSPSLKI